MGFLKKLGNAASIVAAPFTGGASLLLNDKVQNKISSVWKDFTGQTAVDKANAANVAEAQKNRDWQEMMSNTAHQREFADLKAAGINPVTTGLGSGATTPGGAQATNQPRPSNMQGIMGMASSVASLASGASGIANAVKTINENKYVPQEKKAQIANTAADTVLKGAQTTNTQAGTQKINAEKEQINEITKQIKIDNITRKEMNTIELAFKKSNNAKVQQEAIKEAISNAYMKETGTAPNQTTIERFTSMIWEEINAQTKGGQINPNKAIKDAIKKIEEIN